MITELESGGGGSVLNVYAQLAEPKVKDGIWVKTEETNVNKPKYNANIPFGFPNKGSAVAIGTDIYLFGIFNSTLATYCAYKYDTLTNTYTKLKDIPYAFYEGSAVAIGTDIYLFGTLGESTTQQKYAYKYDTLTDTYTKLKNIPYAFANGDALSVGSNIYLFGTSVANYENYAYKYDTITNTYTKLANIPVDVSYGAAAVVDTDIYIFSGRYPYDTYKYDISTNNYTKLNNMHGDHMASAVAIGTDIYILGSSQHKKLAYKYDVLTNKYTQLTNIPYDFYNGNAIVIDNNIYLLGGSESKTTNYTYIYNINLPQINKYKYNKLEVVQQLPTTPENDSVYIIYGSTYATKLLEQLVLNFANVQLYKNNETQLYPIYYGNGEEWIKILN